MTREEKREYDIKYRAANPERIKANNLKWRTENKDRAKENHKKWRDENPDKIRSQAMKYKYKITLKDYETLLILQDFKCAICSRHEEENRKPFVVDHDHNTGEVRGLLCFRCNTGIGQLGDSTLLLSKAIQYLNSNN